MLFSKALKATSLAVAMAAGIGGGAVSAQDLSFSQSTVLIVDPGRLFRETRFGQRVAGELEAEDAVLTAENRRIESELTAEERGLTDARADMTPGDFRAAANAFDEKVQRIRAEQEAKARARTQAGDNAQRQFLAVARPVLNALMVESGAEVMLDVRAVLLTSGASDVTEEAVRRIDEALGDGRELGAPGNGDPDTGAEPDK